MKKSIRFLLIVSLLVSFALSKASAQVEVVIIGPTELCFGECATYELLVLDSSAQLIDFSWQVNGVTISNTNPVTLCADSPDGFNIFVSGIGDIFGNIFDFGTEMFVDVSTSSANPTIVSVSALCPTDSLVSGGCEKICAFNSATYEVTGIPPGTSVTWQVLGADDFVATGNQVTVDWGAPGQGEVSVAVDGSGSAVDVLQIHCGQSDQYVLQNNTLGGAGFLTIFGGVGPYDVLLSSPSLTEFFTYTSGGIYQFPDLTPDSYFITVTDANGTSVSCQFTIVATDNECWNAVLPIAIIQSTDCDDCNGGIQVMGTSNAQIFEYIWSTGETGQSIDGLCPGIYSVTITDDEGCENVADFTIECPQPTTCSGEASLCVEILEEPKAEIGSIPPAVSGVIEVCQGQTVYFENESLNATSYVWDFGDLNTSALFEPNHTYLAAGNYTVQLIARNECFCADTTELEVNVLPAAVPEINCIGTICEGETVTYSTDVMCSTYDWIVTGSANVLDGGGSGDNFITVEWLAGPEGTISLAVNGCAGSVCIVPNVVPIPIISDDVQIVGPDKVCEGSTEEYFIPNYQGTQITWSVEGSGNIVDGQGSERITINWYGDAGLNNPQLVIVEFENCYLGCSGRDSLEVNIVPSFFVQGPIEVCESSTTDYQSVNTISGALIPANWEVFNATGTSVWTSAAATTIASVPWNFPEGSYIVHATAANTSGFCNDTYEVFVKLVQAPPLVSNIDGETSICPGETYTYLANGNPPNDYTWTVLGGTPVTVNGSPANVTWDVAGPYSLSVVQISTTGLACESDPLDLAIGPIPAFTISGEDDICLEDVGTYSVPFFENIDYDWTISPADVGTITSGFGSESVQIQWHASGPATVSVGVCGAVENFNVNVLTLPEPVAQFPPAICAGELATVTTTVAYPGYSWKDDTGAQIFTVPNPMLGDGHYEVEVTDADGCVGDAIFEIIEYALPPISISLPAYQAVCPGGPDITIYSVTIGGGGYTYEWFRDGTPIGGNTPDLVTNQAGNYEVIVTDLNSGCTASSGTQTVLDCAAIGGTCVGGVCGFGAGGCPDCTLCDCGGGGCASNGNIDFNFGPTANCDELAFFNTSTLFVPGTLGWNFGDPASGATNTSALENPTHEFTDIGYYTVFLDGLIQPTVPGEPACYDYIYYDVLIPIKAFFEFNPACPGAPVQFNDRSIFVTGGNITDWEWDFGDPASGAANTSILQNPTHVFDAPGDYTVTLTLTEASGCQVSTTEIVTVFTPPAISYPLPSITCENTALPFDAVVPADYASLSWNFGDPGSGVANTSEVQNSFHEFDAAGPYTVTLNATNIQGCTNTYSDVVNVTVNPLNGTIAFSQPSPICEGDSVTLTSPAGGVIWDWTSGSVNEEITVFSSGVYDVTLTNADGCTYSPPDAIVDVLAEPNGIIKAVEYNEFGQPVAFFESPYSTCEGEDVYLVIQGSVNNSYVWSTGEPGDEISFTDDKGNLLSVGTHEYTVTVTDGLTGCTSEEGPFEVVVNPVPDVDIMSVPGGFLCENNMATLSIVSPDPLYTYQWNTGETTTSIDVVAGGAYFAQAINQFGCKGRSDEIELNNAPDIDLIPTGCLDRCNPDTMCLPNMQLVSSYQWFIDGVPIAAPNGTQAEPIFDQSGEYSVQMVDIFGCTSTSDILTLDLYPGFGDITGNVWYDVNGNGIIDGPDTLVNGIDIILNDGAVNLDTVTTGSTGYYFVGVGADGYTLEMDTMSLPMGWAAYWVEGSLSISGCDVEEGFDWLVVGCIPSFETQAFEACEGDGIMFDGTFVPAGTEQNFVYPSFNGCDSIIVVDVAALVPDTIPLQFDICENTTIDYQGVTLSPGDVQDFAFTNINGCDSTVQVSVVGLPVDAEPLQLATCQGVPVIYDGIPLNIGDVQDFLFMNQHGCDSTVTVTVIGATVPTSQLELETCVGTTVVYEGVTMAPGDMEDFILQDQNGCDSMVQVTVLGLPTDAVPLQLSTCPGVPVIYDGVPLNIGDIQAFVFANQNGCDSTVTVTVASAPVPMSELELTACEGTTVVYEGVTLSPGDQQDFVLQDPLGCDSIVEVTVVGLMNVTEQLFLPACDGTTIVYQGVTLAAGDQMDFIEIASNGCDSIIQLTVVATPVDTTYLTLEVCEGETVNFNGQQMVAGDEASDLQVNQFGCDSLILASAVGLPSVNFDLLANEICWNASDGSVEVMNILGSSPPYVVSIDGVTFQMDLTFENLVSGPYTVYLQDENDCIFDNEIELPAIPPVIIDAQDETMACGDIVELNPVVVSQLPYTWLWPDGSTEPTYSVDAPGIYNVQVINDCEIANHEIQVGLDADSRVARIYMPNSFSPNSDGINDCYQGYLAPHVDVDYYLLRIFDRWGNQMFESTNPDECWDGEFRGEPMDPAVFAWFVELRVRNCDGQMIDYFEEGGIHLMK